MQEALSIARKGMLNGEVPVGAAFVETKTGKVLARSHNLTVLKKNATTHCEINCMRELAENGKILLEDCTLYVTVEPCIMCAYALAISHIGRVVYGCSNEKFGGTGTILSLHNCKSTEFNKTKPYSVTKGVCED
jgi:tRNA(Arg) A34 adenosine deaminase TadA